MNKEITIGKAQKLVDEWIQKYGVRYFNELTNMAILKNWDWFTVIIDSLWGGILFSLSVFIFRLF